MGFKVILTPQSLDDLKDIVSFIAKAIPRRAATFGNELIDRALAIATFPDLGRVVPEVGEPAIREIIHSSYRIIHEVFFEQETIYVLRFWHGARGDPEIAHKYWILNFENVGGLHSSEDEGMISSVKL